MSLQYCITMMNVPRRRERDTLPLIMISDSEPALFDSVEDASNVIVAYKEWHPEIEYEIREFFGKSHFAYEENQWGTWMMGKRDILATA